MAQAPPGVAWRQGPREEAELVVLEAQEAPEVLTPGAAVETGVRRVPAAPVARAVTGRHRIT